MALAQIFLPGTDISPAFMPTLHPLFTHHAVVSAKRPRIRGTATPGLTVTVTIAGRTVTATADASGNWLAEFPALPPGGPHTLTARDASGEVSAHDLFLGGVWLGSGQSNMEWSLALTKDSEPDIQAANVPLLRVFTVTKAQQLDGPKHTLTGRWQVCTPQEAPSISAIAYFFGRKMVAETGLPFGMVVSAWGGSCIAPWLPESTLDSRPEYAGFLEDVRQARTETVEESEYKPHEDPGIAAHAADWAGPGFDDSAWAQLLVPGQWQNEGWAFNGAVWFRRTIEIPPEWVGRDLELYLGVVDDFDRTFVNGTLVGAMGPETPCWWATPRHHKVPAALVNVTTLHVAVRVFDIWGNGGITGAVTLSLPDDPKAPRISLRGSWRARAELKLPLRSPGGPALAPTVLWNAMIHPLIGLGLDGFLWYQGESDVGRARLYQRLLSDLIRVWRHAFDAPELPFGIVQLANYMERKTEPGDDPWAELREAQRRVAATVPACGLAVAIDAGEADDIHPRYKRVVGERLALWAMHSVHGRRDLACSGPLYAEHWAEGDGIRVRFVHAAGLRVRGDGLRGFQIAGLDRRWVWAQAEIRGDTVFVRSPQVSRPLAVRYAWQANPETTLENAAGLPASPFRTDDWPEIE
jgi:sialate O-acetylesterase